MATSIVRQTIGIANDTITKLTVRFEGTSGSAASAIQTVPATKIWRIKAVSVANPDTVARAIHIEVLDPTGAVVMSIAGDIVTTVAQNLQVRAQNCDYDLPEGYQIRATITALGAFVPVLCLDGFEYNKGLPSSILTLD